MPQELRKTGIGIIGDVPWGTHFCQFYRTPQDLLDILVPYFAAGLENNEFCMWITSEPLGVEAARAGLAAAVPDLEDRVRKGQIEILPHTEWYLKGGSFDSARVLDGWVKKLEAAQAAGFAGLRLTGNTFWLEKKDWVAFRDYEAEVDAVIGRYLMLAVCTYSIDRCGANEILDVIANHRFALIRRDERWEIVESAQSRRAQDDMKRLVQFPAQNPNPVLRISASGDLIYANPPARGLLEVLGGTPAAPVHSALLALATAAAERKGVLETELGDRHGHVHWLTAVRPEGETFVNLYALDITTRKQAEESLQQNREWLRVTLTSIGDAVLATDVDCRVTFLNPIGCTLTGWSAEEALGRPIGEIFRIINEYTREPGIDLCGRVIEERRAIALANNSSLIAKDGREVPIEDSAAPILDGAGNVTGAVLVFHDVTAKRQAQKSLRESEERFRTLFSGMTEGFALHDIVTDASGRPVDYRFLDLNPAFERLTGLNRGETVGRLVTEVLPGIEPFWIETYGKVALTGEPVTFERYYPAPLDRWYQVYSYRPAPGRFAVIFMDISERKKAEAEIERISRQRQLALDAARLGWWHYDPAARFSTWDDRYREIFGVSGYQRPNDEILSEIIYPDDLPALWAEVEAALDPSDPQPYAAEYRIRRPDGQVRWIKAHGLATFEGAGESRRATSLVGTVEDITDRKLAEEALRESEAKLETMFAAIPDAVFEYDPSGRAVRVNEAGRKALGLVSAEFTREQAAVQLKTRNLDGSVPEPQDYPTARAMRGEFVSGAVFRISTPDSGEHIISTNAAPIRKSDGAIAGAVAVWHDITELKGIEETLRLRQAEIQALFDNTPAGLVLFDAKPPYTVLVHNRYYQELFAEPFRTGGMVGLSVYQYAPAVEAEGVVAVFDEVVRTKAPKHFLDFPYQSNPPRQSWFNWHMSPIILDGEVAALVSMSVDVTDRHLAEEALRESEERYRGVVENTTAVILRVDPQGVIRFANERALVFFGYAKDELIGKHAVGTIIPEKDSSGRDLATMVDEIAKAPDRFQTNANENIRKGGERVWMEWTNSGVYDDEGRLVEFLSVGIDASERRKAQEELARSNQKLAQVLESIQDDFYVLDRDWNFVYANRQFTSRVGKEPADLVGRNIWETFPKHVGGILYENFHATMEKREVRRFEVGGSYTNALYSMTSFPSAEGITVLGRDITEQKKAEELRQALAEQERLRLGAAVEQASEAVVMVDLDGTIRYVNAAFEAINRTPREKALGASYFELLGTDESVQAIRGAILAGERWHGQLTRSIEGGRPVELEVTISPAADPSGKTIGGLITEKDVTQESALQRQVRQAQKMEALGTLAGGITHDFNNILGAIIINTELALLDLSPTHPARQSLPVVLQAANRGKELVKQIITFSRQREWERKPLEVGPIVKEGMKFLRSTLSKDITIHESIAADGGFVLADPSQIHQILVNLCQNAALAMADSGGQLEVRLERVEVDASLAARHPDLRPGPYLHLVVEDTGCGMSRDVMERIFEPFFTTRTQGQGSGLGLSVVHGIVKSYDGAIIVYSEPGKGSVFHVYLPSYTGGTQTEEARRPLRAEKGRESILLVEDEPGQLKGITRLLERLGYKVTAKSSGRTALTAFKKNPNGFDLVITDQTMPRMTGAELAEAVFKIRPDIPTVLCTGFSEKVNGETVGHFGIRSFIMKPFSLQEISKQIREALKK